jgi:hypothetical protein
MKKFFAIAILAVAFVACNNSGKKTETTDTTTKMDSPVVAPTTVDTTHMDTTKTADTTAPKM